MDKFAPVRMDNSGNTDIIFMDSLTGYHPAVRHGQILHVLCMEGSMSFVFQDVMYNIAAWDIMHQGFMSLLTICLKYAVRSAAGRLHTG